MKDLNKMLRFSANCSKLLNRTLITNQHVFLLKLNPTPVTRKSCNLAQHAFFSSDTKSNTPLGNLIAKEAPEKNQDEKDEEEAKKQRDASWKKMKLTLMVFGVSFGLLGGYMVFVLGAPEKDMEGKDIRDEFTDMPLVKQFFLRTYRELDYYRRLIKEPSRDKLLPDPLEYPYLQPKYTLVLEVTDVLVHPDWTYKTGWRFKKRPGLDQFLENLHGHYEIVIYTAEQGMTVFPLIEAIDPKNIISYKLVRDATHFSGGSHVKSLNNLNRDLTKVIVVDWNAEHVKFNPDNLFKIKRWSGNDDDSSLFDLTNFLKAIVDNEIEDVRDVLKNYNALDDPIEAFRERQKKYIDTLEAQAALKREQEPSRFSRWTPSIFRKSF